MINRAVGSDTEMSPRTSYTRQDFGEQYFLETTQSLPLPVNQNSSVEFIKDHELEDAVLGHKEVISDITIIKPNTKPKSLILSFLNYIESKYKKSNVIQLKKK